MNLKEIEKDLFTVNFNKYTPAHCISRDCKMGAGIAVLIRKKFELNSLLNFIDSIDVPVKEPQCVLYNGVLNLITKKKYFHKPTYESLGAALMAMRALIENNNINKVVMPKIGCGLDGLVWPKVREVIFEIFNDLDLEILVCYL